jgi:2-methylisocitrate lyase-like PEP mutase family enzyme
MDAKAREFRELHRSGCFVMPNPWDLGGLRILTRLGFKALATTSAGFAWSLGRPDSDAGLERTLEHLRLMAAASSLPINADFEGGFARDPERVHAHFGLAARTGIAGISIEDSIGHADEPLLDLDLAVRRVAAARRAIDDAGTGVLLTARSEGLFIGCSTFEETVRRLVAYAEAGADCLYAPGLKDPGQIKALVDAVAPRPVNVLLGSGFSTVDALAGLGVRRISVGGALARVALTAFLGAAKELAESGSFERSAGALTYRETNELFEP